MREFAVDLLIRRKSVQNVIADVAQNFHFDVDSCFGVRTFRVYFKLHYFLIKLYVFEVDVDFEIASLKSESN